MSVVVISDKIDLSVCEVISWLENFGTDVIISDFFSFNESLCFAWELDLNRLTVKENDTKGTFEINSIWFKGDYGNLNSIKWNHNEYLKIIKDNLFWEIETYKQSLWSQIEGIKYLSNYNSDKLNKLFVLEQAGSNNLPTPKSLITNNKESLLDFYNKNNPIICKAAFENISTLKTSEGYLKQYVEEINLDFINNLPDKFFPSFFQEKINKEYDVRVFYLDGKCYSMAIFSDKTDYRADYKTHKNVPFLLPKIIEENICKLMNSLNLNTGSIDFVKSLNDDLLYFLEINPNGQFAMVSKPCNYYIEKQIAKYLYNEQ